MIRNSNDGLRLPFTFVGRTPINRRSISTTGPLQMGRRSRRKNGEDPKIKSPRAVMQIVDGGVPEVAQVYPELYEELLAEKVTILEQLIQDTVTNSTSTSTGSTIPPTEVFQSPRTAFRMRANFKIWRAGSNTTAYTTDYVMFERGDSRTPVQVVSYPMGSTTINTIMGPILEGIRSIGELREAINDIRFVTTTTGDALVTITYNRKIGDEWIDAIHTLTARGRGTEGLVKFVGRSRKVKLIVGGAEEEGDTIDETLCVPGIEEPLYYRQTEGAFSQPNAVVCQLMLGWATDVTKLPDSPDNDTTPTHDLCELYCGNGCFTVALARNFRRVVATEMSKASVQLAQYNLEVNGITNTKVARLNAEDFVDAYEGNRKFRRLEDAGICIVGAKGGERGTEEEEVEDDVTTTTTTPDDTNTKNKITTMTFDKLQTLFVDPPRAGLDETCRRLASQFDRVVYVSCNPETLVRDLAELLETHELERVAAFDQFPYTPHLEAGVVLVKKR